MNIGQRMRERRIELNINPKDIAEKIGKSVSTYYRYETGEIEKLTISKLREIADILNVSPVYLLLGNEQKPQNTVKANYVNYDSSNFSVPYYKASQSFSAYPSEEYSTQKIKEILSSLKISLEEFSSLTGISVEQLEIYKKGEQYVEHKHISAIAEALNISEVDIFLKRDDTILLKKISKLNAVELKKVELYVDSMIENKKIAKKSTY